MMNIKLVNNITINKYNKRILERNLLVLRFIIIQLLKVQRLSEIILSARYILE